MSQAWREPVRAIGDDHPEVAYLATLLSQGSFVSRKARHELIQVGHELRLLRALRDAVAAGDDDAIEAADSELFHWYERVPRYAERSR